jgi:AcrR family transcriptional regulator
MPGERLRDQKRDETRRRLLEAASRLFGEQGYDQTTSAQIAEAAGVSERTLFRHFDSKADLLLGNRRSHAAAFRADMAAQPDDAPPIEVVRAGLRAWAKRLERNQEREQTMAALGARLPVMTMLEIVLANEAFIATELGRRLSRSDEDVDIRMAANASIGVLRAASRARVVEHGTGSLPRMVSRGLDRLAPLFDALERETTSGRSGARRSSARQRPARTASPANQQS